MEKFLPSESELSKVRVEDHDHKILKDKPSVVTRAALWKIPHDSGKSEINLKIGRYNKIKQPIGFISESVEVSAPKSELTLDNEEFQELIAYLSERYEPFKSGTKKYLSLDESFDKDGIEFLRAIFNNKDRAKVLQEIVTRDVIPDDFISALSNLNRIKAIREFEEMLQEDLNEQHWQSWFKRNSWVLGSDYVRILDERNIDTKNIADYLMQAYDGFLDIIEIKKPQGLAFWAGKKDHENYYTSTELIKAITQAHAYCHEVEQEADSHKSIQRMDGVRVIKPRCVLIFGRSLDWNEEQQQAYRLLNCSYQNLTILTYDHVLNRAKRIADVARSTEIK